MLFEQRADAVLVSTLKLGNLFSVFVHLKGGHTFDTFSARDYASFVYVAPAESPACVLFFYRQSCKNGSYALAGLIPSFHEENDHWFVRGISN